jgi:hypothetical protein
MEEYYFYVVKLYIWELNDHFEINSDDWENPASKICQHKKVSDAIKDFRADILPDPFLMEALLKVAKKPNGITGKSCGVPAIGAC